MPPFLISGMEVRLSESQLILFNSKPASGVCVSRYHKFLRMDLQFLHVTHKIEIIKGAYLSVNVIFSEGTDTSNSPQRSQCIPNVLGR